MTCAACGRENREGARFCDACGAPLRVAETTAAEPGARKVVTIVFADLIGSTALHERLDAESAHRLMGQYYRALHGAVTAHGGRVVKLLGDGLMAAFGIPRVAEDDALRAVRAAAAMQAAFRDLERTQPAGTFGAGLRVAVNTGEVVVSADQADIVGDPVNVAARLQQLARDGDVLIGEATRRLVGDRIALEPLGALALRGRAGAVPAYRVVSLEPPAGRQTTPFVGRAAELQRLHSVVDEAFAAPTARLAVVLGSPGLGKTRLIAELTRRLDDRATVLAVHCDAAGGGTFTPLADALRAGLGVEAGADPSALRAALTTLRRRASPTASSRCSVARPARRRKRSSSCDACSPALPRCARWCWRWTTCTGPSRCCSSCSSTSCSGEPVCRWSCSARRGRSCASCGRC